MPGSFIVVFSVFDVTRSLIFAAFLYIAFALRNKILLF